VSAINKNKNQKPELPKISDAEWTVLKAVWQLSSPTAREVVEQLKGQSDWKPKTIHTLLARLVQKGALATEKSGREHVFQPLVSERDCRLTASHSFLEKVFDGEIAPFLATFLESKKLTRKEIDELKSILEEKIP
jgi:BlaI family penicillinase repressor